MKEKESKYTQTVVKRFLHPKNMGKIKNPDAVAMIQNPICKDTMKVYLKIKNNKIKDIKFQTVGCAAAISSSDITCDLVKGKTLKVAKSITKKDILRKLGGLPKIKEHCSLLGEKAIRKAIEDYEKSQKAN